MHCTGNCSFVGNLLMLFFMFLELAQQIVYIFFLRITKLIVLYLSQCFLFILTELHFPFFIITELIMEIIILVLKGF